MKVRIGAVDLDRLVPDHRLQPRLRLPVELDEARLPLGVDQPEGVDAKTLHEPERPRDGPVGHDPHDHVHRLRHQRDEVPEGVVRRLRLRKATVGLGLRRVDQVGELDRVLDEEDRNVVADEVPVPLLRIEPHRETAHVPRQIRRSLAAGDRREAHEGLGLFACALEDIRRRELGDRLGAFEISVRTEAARMHHPFRDPLVVEVEDLLAEMRVFHQRWPALPGAQRVLIVRNRMAPLGRQHRNLAPCKLVRFASGSAQDRLVAEPSLGTSLSNLAVIAHGIPRELASVAGRQSATFTAKTAHPHDRSLGGGSVDFNEVQFL